MLRFSLQTGTQTQYAASSKNLYWDYSKIDYRKCNIGTNLCCCSLFPQYFLFETIIQFWRRLSFNFSYHTSIIHLKNMQEQRYILIKFNCNYKCCLIVNLFTAISLFFYLVNWNTAYFYQQFICLQHSDFCQNKNANIEFLEAVSTIH